MAGTAVEAAAFLGAVYGGLVIGLLFSVFRLPHALIGGTRIVAALLDLLFYAGAGIVAALTLYRVSGGALRVYTLAGIGLGIYLALRAADPVFRAVARWIENLTRRASKKGL